MLANIIIKPGRIELREIETPRPSTGELLIKIKAALTCGTDLKAFIRGHHIISMPGVLGHEFSGIVAAVGKGAKGFKEGDEIMAVHSAPCLRCKYCNKRIYNLCEKIMNTKTSGAFAEYIILPPHIVRQNTFIKPKKITFEEAAFLEPLSCVIHGIELINIKKDDFTIIIGSGPIGLLHLMLLKEKGATVTVMDKHNNKLKIAKDLGADFIIKRKKTTQNLLLIHNLLAKKAFKDFIGFDYVFECTGKPDVWETSIDFVRKGGTVVLFGGCKSGTMIKYDAGRIHYDEITLKGVFHYTPSDVKKAYNFLCNQKLDIKKLISGRYSLKHVQRAFENLAKGKGIKYSIIP